MADEAFDAAQRLPLTERLVHSLWKVRQAAYLELEKRYAEAFDGNDTIFKSTSTYTA